MADEKVYCGNAKKIQTQYGEMIKLSLSESDLQKLKENLDNGWVNANVLERRAPSASGMTHYLVVDTWKPDPSKRSAAPVPSAPKAAPAPGGDFAAVEDLPF
ncbi:hypothetical protein HN954_00655 [bacterium]|jgi:hypothetical protein|nr:hypothetical protein [bacterium]MBT6832380.1 hypothetical protein [bacterium]MBT6995925.1 hypothetical protein [bacterium]MBT7772786.1 hypothetical protein [bacterium]